MIHLLLTQRRESKLSSSSKPRNWDPLNLETATLIARPCEYYLLLMTLYSHRFIRYLVRTVQHDILFIIDYIEVDIIAGMSIIYINVVSINNIVLPYKSLTSCTQQLLYAIKHPCEGVMSTIGRYKDLTVPPLVGCRHWNLLLYFKYSLEVKHGRHRMCQNAHQGQTPTPLIQCVTHISIICSNEQCSGTTAASLILYTSGETRASKHKMVLYAWDIFVIIILYPIFVV